MEGGFVPVFSAITHDGQGQLLNTNADTIASALAVALSSRYDTSLVYCFEKRGVLRDVENEDSVIPEIRAAEFEELQATGIVAAGLVPKLHNAFDALATGVRGVCIGQAASPHLLHQQRICTRMVRGLH